MRSWSRCFALGLCGFVVAASPTSARAGGIAVNVVPCTPAKVPVP